MRYFPLFLDLQERVVLLLGDPEALAAKAGLLQRAGARLRYATAFTPDALQGVALVFGAGAPQVELEALAEACKAANIPCNIIDQPALCSFIMPAIIDRDPVVVAVGTGGAAPVLARMVRQQIEALLAPGLGRLAALAARFQRATRAALPDLGRRRRFLEEVLAGPAASLALAGRVGEAESHYARSLGDAASSSGPVSRPGMVHLVGAGPGDADLLTLRALRLLGEADVVVHDRLVSRSVLDMARRDARLIFVGKACGQHSMPQEDINALLVRLGREGLRVVRLKGGDPFVFGRGGEELEALRLADIPCAVVPGITAALACAAQAGIPLTHRSCAPSLVCVTGHRRNGRVSLDFAALARPGQTLAIYMGVGTLPAILQGLADAGYDLATPAALIENGGSAQQRCLRGTAREIGARAAGWLTAGPALLLLGEVCSLDAPLAVERPSTWQSPTTALPAVAHEPA